MNYDDNDDDDKFYHLWKIKKKKKILNRMGGGKKKCQNEDSNHRLRFYVASELTVRLTSEENYPSDIITY